MPSQCFVWKLSQGVQNKTRNKFGASMELSYITGPGSTTDLNVSLNKTMTSEE